MSVKVNLQSLWPRHGWSDHINDERTDDILHMVDAMYSLIRLTPRENEGVISDQQWIASYENGVEILKALFRKSQTIEDVLSINERFAERLMLDFNKLSEQPLYESYHYWAISQYALNDCKSYAFDIDKIKEELPKVQN